MSSAPPMHAGSDQYVPPVALYPEGETVRIVENAEDREPTPDSQDGPAHPLGVAAQDIGRFIPSLRYGVAEDKGSRSMMEDAHLCIDDIGFLLKNHLEMPRARAFFAVFDGHGGEDAAHYARDHILANIIASDSFPAETEKAMAHGFLRTDLDFDQACIGGDVEASGTTVVAALVWGCTLYVANAGDCRCVLSRRGKAIELSEDHKPTSTSELERIKSTGGFVEDGYLNGILGASRAIGDWHLQIKGEGGLKSSGPLTSEPEVQRAAFTGEDEFMIMACDGLWDVFSSQNAVEFARSQLRQHNDPGRCSQELVAEALRRHTTDNVSCITVCFTPHPPPKREWTNKNSVLGGGLRRAMSGEALSALQVALNTDR